METMEKSFSQVPNFRDLVATVAGPRGWNDTRQSWLARAAQRAGISYRQAHALFYGEITDPQSRSATKMRTAAEQIGNLGNLVDRLEVIDLEFNEPTITAYRAVLRQNIALLRQLDCLERGAPSTQGDAEGLEE